MPGRLIYTVITKGYDTLKPAPKVQDGTVCICITNDCKFYDKQRYRGWIIQVISEESVDTISFNRNFKFKPWLFGDFDESIYVDGNVFLLRNPFDFVTNRPDIALFRHRKRRNVYEEFNHLVSLENTGVKDFGIKYWPCNWLILCLNQSDLFWGGFIYRKHNTIIKSAMCDWWNIYEEGITRDQISLPYVIDKNQLCISLLKNINENLYVFPHRKKNSIYSGLLDICTRHRSMLLFFINVILPIRRFIK